MPTTKKVEPETVDTLHQNMRFYGLVQDTPKDAQKPFNNGRFSGTDINPMWRIKKLTEIFGPCGFGWWTQNVRYDFVQSEQTNEVAVFCELELVVKDPASGETSQPIYGVGGNTFVAQRRSGPQASDEAKKMAYTDALSIACKSLGFSHDIYYQNDRTKYSMPAETAPAKQETKVQNEPAAKSEPTVKEEPKSEPMPENILPLEEVIKELDLKVSAMQSVLTEDRKRAFGEWMKSKLGMMNYRKCTDVVALNNVLNELRAS